MRPRIVGSELKAVALTAILGLSLASCGLEKPKQPTWDTQFVVPLISHNYDMIELVDRMAEDNLGCDSLGNISISFDYTIDTTAVDAGLSVSGSIETYIERVGDLEIGAPQPMSDDLTLSDYTSLGAGGSVPGLAINANGEFEPMEDFDQANVASGSLIISVSNNFGLHVDSAEVYVFDLASFEVYGPVRFDGGIPDGATRSESIDLAGKSVFDRYGWGMLVYTAADTLLSLAEKNFTLAIEFSEDFTVSSGTVKISPQTKEFVRNIELESEHEITSGLVAGGNVTVQVTNLTSLDADVELRIDELTISGTPLTLSVALDKQQSCQFNEQLAGYRLQPTPEIDNPNVNLDLIVAIEGTGDQLVSVESYDSLDIVVTISDLEFSEVTGVIAPTEIAIDPIDEELDIPIGFDGVSLRSAILTIELESTADLPSVLDLAIANDRGDEVVINHPIERGAVGSPGATLIEVTDLTDFLDPIPHSISISGVATAGDGMSTGTVTSESYIVGDVSIFSPLEITVGESSFEADINEADLKDLDEDLTDRLRSATMSATLTNHFPLEAIVILCLKGDSTGIYENPDLTIGPIAVDAGLVSETGLVTASAISEFSTTLDDADLDILKNETLYIGQIISFESTDGGTVRIINSDFINVDAYIVITATLGDF